MNHVYGGFADTYQSHQGGCFGQPTVSQMQTSANMQGLIRSMQVAEALNAELLLAEAFVFPSYGADSALLFWDREDFGPENCRRWIDPHPWDSSLSDEDKTSIMALLQDLIKIKGQRRAENSAR